MPILRVLTNEKGEVVGTAQTDVPAHGSRVPGSVAVVPRPGQRIIEVTVDESVAGLEPSVLHEYIKRHFINHAGENATPESTDEATRDSDLVITPAGPMPRDKVHQVQPGEIVSRGPEGTHTIRKADPGRRPTKRR
jgi:hypothetical protein